MDAKHAIVVNPEGYKVEFILVHFQADGNGAIKEIPDSYTVQPLDSLVYDDVGTALGMVKPRWTGAAWEETATPDEIAAAHPPAPPPVPVPPNDMELMLMEALAEQYEAGLVKDTKIEALENQNIDIMMAMADIYEMALGGVV